MLPHLLAHPRQDDRFGREIGHLQGAHLAALAREAHKSVMEPDQKAVEAHLRPLIEQELAELRQQSDATREHRQPVELDQQSVGRLSRMDALQMQAMANAVEQRRRSRIVALDQALRRMNDGDYGYCVDCDEFIGEKRLEIDPAALKCVRCA